MQVRSTKLHFGNLIDQRGSEEQNRIAEQQRAEAAQRELEAHTVCNSAAFIQKLDQPVHEHTHYTTREALKAFGEKFHHVRLAQHCGVEPPIGMFEDDFPPILWKDSALRSALYGLQAERLVHSTHLKKKSNPFFSKTYYGFTPLGKISFDTYCKEPAKSSSLAKVIRSAWGWLRRTQKTDAK
jgi:hypothetical protein